MRINEEFSADINIPLTPEWPTLTARARGAVNQIAATRCTAVNQSDRYGYALFNLTFNDGTTTSLRIGALDTTPAAWVFWMGGEAREHDLLKNTMSHEIRVSHQSDVWYLESAAGYLHLNELNPSIKIYDRNRNLIWQSNGPDLFVGDVPMSFAFYKHANGFGCSLDMGACKTIVGGGEQFGGINLRGRIYDVMNSDALGVNGHLRYQSTPFFLTNDGHSFAMLQCEPSRIDFGARRHDIVSFASDGPILGLYLALPTLPAAAIEQWRALMGGVTHVPDWSYGLWLSRCFYKDEKEVRAVVEGNKKHVLGASVINLDARAWMRAQTRTDFVWDTSRWSAYESFIPWLREQGFHVCLWENPYVSSATETLYHEGVKKGFFAKNGHGDVYPYQWVPTGLEGFPQPPIAGLVDFTNSKAREWWKDLHRPFLRAGVTCFKTDFGEEIPHDAVFSDGSTGKQLRNVYSDLYNLCVMEVMREECGDQGILWARSGFTKMGKTPVKWAGDSQTSWNALRASLRAGLSQSVGGAVFWSHDIGGFYGPLPSPELFIRWTQVGLWGSHARMHGTSPREPWEFGNHALQQVKKDLALRHKLKQYFIACGKECAQNQQSFIRPMWLECPSDAVCWTIEDQFFSGSKDILVAPYLSAEGGRTVYLPKGSWTCLADHNVYEGGDYLQIPRWESCPVFINNASSWKTIALST